ncbi:MAG: creatininase family protein [Bacteroidetes bacterium]|nr:creatininase family protein [Bacteroidota bacterium]
MKMDSVLYEVKMPKSLEEMTWKEVQEVLKKTNIAIFSTGATEQHGYHLPLNTDNLIAIELSKRTAKILEKEGITILVGPCLPIGVNPEALNYPGSLTLHPDTMKRLIKEVCLSLKHHGIEKILLLVGHDGNIPAMEMAVQELMIEQELEVASVDWLLVSREIQSQIFPINVPDGHGGAGETSRAMAIIPNLVALDKAVPYLPEGMKAKIKYSSSPGLGGRVYNPIRNSRFKEYPDRFPGQLGDPRKANREVGEQLLDGISNWIARVIKQEFLNT